MISLGKKHLYLFKNWFAFTEKLKTRSVACSTRFSEFASEGNLSAADLGF